MEVVSAFEIDAAPDPVWEMLLDVPRVIPCMPGAELVEAVDESSWKARVGTRLGPMSLDFDVDITREEVDESSRSVRLSARASDRSGRGGATATITSRLQATEAGSGVEVRTDLALTGAVARFGRQGLVRDVAAQMTDQFAANLRRELLGPEAAAAEGAAAAPQPSPAPAAGRDGELTTGRMILGLLLRALIRRLERLLERVEQPKGHRVPEA